MSQCYDRGAICACPPVAYEPHKMQRLMPRHNLFYPLDSTPNQPNLFQSNTSAPAMDHCATKQSNTLQSVLLGKVPAAYSHLTSQRKSPYQLSPPHSASSPRRSPHSPHSFLSIPSRTPPTGSPQSFQISQEIPFSRQFSPQCPLISSPHRSSPRHMPSPHLMPSPRPSPSPRHSVSPASSCSTEICQDEPIDLSCKVVKEENCSPSGDDKDNGGFSLLRNLLCVGKNQSSSQKSQEATSDHSDTESCVGVHVTGTTPVTLAKKNMYPVGSRVSDWLVKIIQFAKSIPEFVNLSHNDKVTLILNSWTRLLLLYMSESNFQFAVTPIHSEQQSEESEDPPPSQPTMKSVENLQSFIRKCQTMNLDQKEYAFLRMAVLFNSGELRLYTLLIRGYISM